MYCPCLESVHPWPGASNANTLKKGLDQGRRPELIGGGLVRSTGGWKAVRSQRQAGLLLKSDERILGSSEFVGKVLAEAQEAMQNKYVLRSKGIGLDEVMKAVARELSLEMQVLIGPGKARTIVKARQLVCHWAVTELGLPMTDVARRLGIAVPTVSVAAKKGRGLADRERWVLADLLNIKV